MANLSDLAQPATPGLLGSGLAQMAGNTLVNRNAYKKYVIDMQSSGEEPLSFEEWSQSQG